MESIEIIRPKPVESKNKKTKSRNVSLEKKESYQDFLSNFKKEQHNNRKFYPKVVKSYKDGKRPISPKKFKNTILDRFKKYEEKRQENLNKLREKVKPFFEIYNLEKKGKLSEHKNGEKEGRDDQEVDQGKKR